MDTSGNDRYSRQERFPAIGREGQARIANSRVAVVGCGALGSAQVELLARAGCGYLRVIDRDYVELSNLQRQLLFDESDAREGLPKAVAAARRVAAVNSGVTVDPVVADLTAPNAEDLLGGVDVILDGSDNFETRYLINDFAVREGMPWIYGAAVGGYGIAMTVVPERTACLRCVYPDPPVGVQPTCETAGVLGPVTAAVASYQAARAMKVLAGRLDELSGEIVTMDLWEGWMRQVAAPVRDGECPCCARREFAYLDGNRRAPVSLCGRNAVQIHERTRPLDLEELARRLGGLAAVRRNEFALRASVDGYELTVFPDGRAIIKGTTDVGVARSLYARYVGC